MRSEQDVQSGIGTADSTLYPGDDPVRWSPSRCHGSRPGHQRANHGLDDGYLFGAHGSDGAEHRHGETRWSGWFAGKAGSDGTGRGISCQPSDGYDWDGYQQGHRRGAGFWQCRFDCRAVAGAVRGQNHGGDRRGRWSLQSQWPESLGTGKACRQDKDSRRFF